MNYQEMSDAEINRLIASYIYPDDQNITPYTHRPDVQVFHKNGCNSMKDYCNSSVDAWPIMYANRIPLNPFRDEWFAGERRNVKDKNPLRAAMIVFLMMKGGE